MTNAEIMEIALQQSAYDCNCRAEDFLSDTNIITESKTDSRARKYLPLPFECDLVSYGNNIVAQTSMRLKPVVEEYINKYPVCRCFETPNINILNDMLVPYNMRVCFMAEYFLPDIDRLKVLECGYDIKIIEKSELADLYKEEWSNALSFDNHEKDMLAVGAFENDRLVGLAGCSADCESMYQIGVDVLPEYRLRGIAASITSRLAAEIIKMGKVPFYCAAWSNIKSKRNAHKCGFYPAWVELTARSNSFIDSLIK